MKIKWNKVTWYSTTLAIVLYVGTFFVGVAIGAYKKSPSDLFRTTTDRHYVNDEFGVEFDRHSTDEHEGEIFVENNQLRESGYSSFIERHEIAPGATIEDAIFAFVQKPHLCELVYEPWIAHSYSNLAAEGQMAIRLVAKNQDVYWSVSDAQRLKATTLSQHQDAIDKAIASITKDCSMYATDNGGVRSYFLYDPVNAPNRFYFVDATTFGDIPFHGTIRILPD